MRVDYSGLPRAVFDIDAGATLGPLELWRATLGQGGSNSDPFPPRIVDALRQLRPRLVRVFLQEYFAVYPNHGAFDWSRLDPYMDALAAIGAPVLATLNLKPPCLFPLVDPRVWRPTDVAEYQELIFGIVRRYSVERPIVTHWEHVNEPDIGESGGCPFHIPTVEENLELYRMIVKPVLEAFPAAKVGGPAMAWVESPILEGFVEGCRREGIPLDFVSWHMYSNNPEDFRAGARRVAGYLARFTAPHPEQMINEWNKGFDFADADHPSYELISVEEMACDPRRAAFVAAAIIAMLDGGPDWSNYFSVWDGGCRPDEFRRFYTEAATVEVMYRHWNETPHRFGLFSSSAKVRPQYFVYQLLSCMGDDRIAITSTASDLHAVAGTGGGMIAALVANYGEKVSRDQIVMLRFRGLKPGLRRLRVLRIDGEQRWSSERLELLPVEERIVEVLPEFLTHVYSPADSVVQVRLEEV